MLDLSNYRRNYKGVSIKVYKSPFKLFEKWFKEAEKVETSEVNAMVLCTVDSMQRPDSRVVLLKSFSENGFIFFTNYNSKKSKDIEENPHTSLLFYWPNIQRQVRILGIASKVSPEESDEYFYSRPLENQIAAIVSNQSQVLESRSALIKKFNSAKQSIQIKRPENWGGYIVKPYYFEFWQGMPSRLHDRLVYKKANNKWENYRLYP
jgi:pyridoxamine 5'-phosphate oxidase